MALRNSALNIKEYTGVDPYLGSTSDSYLGSYWTTRNEAGALYAEMLKKFEVWGFRLERKLSSEFLRRVGSDQRYDFIYVDADHRFLPALWDCCLSLAVLEQDGVLGIDDYANSDTPQVTDAVNEFIRMNHSWITKVAVVQESFCNAGKYIPIVQRSVLIQTKGRGEPTAITMPRKPLTGDRVITDMILDLSLRKMMRNAKRLFRR